MFPRRSEGEESKYPFFEGDGSSSDELRDYGMASDDYEGPPVFDDDQYEDVIEEEEGFVDNYPNFQKDETNVSFSGVVLGVEEESMPVYDTDIEDAIEDEEGFVGKKGFGEEENNMEDVVVVANDLCSSKIQTLEDCFCLLDCVEEKKSFTIQSICMAPSTLRDLSPSSFDPRVVSIGPLHREDENVQAFEGGKPVMFTNY
ncbi:hypothetical protein Tco_0687469 [Tanacetum coccineum]